MDGTIAKRVGELDADSSEVAEDAQHALIAMGPEVLDELIAAAPYLGAFGQLCAIEVFAALKDPRPGDVLMGLLGSENATVRQWAAEALADLEIQRAVPALQRAYEAFRQRGEAPDDSEGVALRWALTDLGAPWIRHGRRLTLLKSSRTLPLTIRRCSISRYGRSSRTTGCSEDTAQASTGTLTASCPGLRSWPTAGIGHFWQPKQLTRLPIW